MTLKTQHRTQSAEQLLPGLTSLQTRRPKECAVERNSSLLLEEASRQAATKPWNLRSSDITQTAREWENISNKMLFKSRAIEIKMFEPCMDN